MLRHALAAALAAALLAPAPIAAATPAGDPCHLIGSAGLPDLIPDSSTLGLVSLAPADVPLPDTVFLRTTAETFNRRWSFALREHVVYVKETSQRGGWRTMKLPDCLRGRITGISADDDEMVAVDDGGNIYTMDHALNAPWTWNWTHRYGTPLWFGGGNTMPYSTSRWSWSVISPGEDKVWRDTAGNDHPVELAKVSHVYALSPDGSRITYLDPWLPADHSYEMATPLEGRFTAEALSAAASTSFVVNRYGDMYTRLFDFDISGANTVFFRYSYDDQRTVPEPSVQLPAPAWTHQPKIPGQITDRISVHKTGPGSDSRELRVEGASQGRTGYWRKAVNDPAWAFVPTDLPLAGRLLDNPVDDRSADPGARPTLYNFATLGAGPTLSVGGFNVGVAETPLAVRAGGESVTLVLHTVDGLRQVPRDAGLTADPRTFNGTIEVPQAVLEHLGSYSPAIQNLLRGPLRGARFTATGVRVTDRLMSLDALGLELRRS